MSASSKGVKDIGAAHILEELLRKNKIKVEDILDVISETMGRDFQSEDVAETLKSLKISRKKCSGSTLDRGFTWTRMSFWRRPRSGPLIPEFCF